MVESVVEFLFKYPPWVFAHGEIEVGSSATTIVVAAAVAGLAALPLLTYPGAGRARRRDLVLLLALRALALAVMLVILARPVLVVRAAAPQQNVVGILLDDSRSMRIADRDGEARSVLLQREFGSPASPLFRAVAERYQVRLFSFSSTAAPVADAGELDFSGTQTRLGDALLQAREELAGLPLAGLVAITDGADTTGAGLAETLLALRAASVPVFTVGLGRDPIPRDIQMGRIVTPPTVLQGTALVVDVPVDHRGYGGITLPLTVETEGQILTSEAVTLPPDGEPLTARVRFVAERPGSHVFRVHVPVQPGEIVAENNTRDLLIQVQDRREKILYVEGEPRFEVKFARMAVDPDKNLQLVVLQRTAENKYLRLHVDDATELASGFPRSRDELFAYRGLVLGSIEASAFSGDQLRMIAEFVDRRGGGLLMLGGPRAFGEGGYAGTPVADVLPVVIDHARRASDREPTVLKVSPTLAGVTHPVTHLGANDRESAALWRNLPSLTSVNAIGTSKPGATVLLTGASREGGEQVVLAYQRFGRGKAMAFPVQDSWTWQLHVQVAVEDMTHEMLWRQLLRWLVADAPDRVAVTTSADHVERGEPVTLTASVADPGFLPVNSARVIATLTAPSGRTVEVPLPWTGQRDGDYRAEFVPEESGAYEVRVQATRKDVSLGSGTGTFRAGQDVAEAFDAGMRAPLLKRLAEETGGRFYTEDTMARLPEDLKYTERGVTTVEERDLWDMPALLLLLVGCLLAEWSYRRRRGLA